MKTTIFKITKKDIKKYQISIFGLDEEGQFTIMLYDDDNEYYIELFATNWLCYGSEFKDFKNGTYYEFKKEVIAKFLKKNIDISEVSGIIMKELKPTINELRDALLDYYFGYEYNSYTNRTYKKSKYNYINDICVHSDFNKN
jgi:hypothetical protein